MAMEKQQVIFKLGDGDFEGGFPQIAIEIHQLGNNGQRELRQLDTQLPPFPEFPSLYQNWQKQYKALLNSARDGFKKAQVTQVSIRECEDCLQCLREGLNEWLDSEEFQATKKRLQQVFRNDRQIEICFVIQTKQVISDRTKDILHRLPWHLWDLFPEGCQVEEVISFRDAEVSDRDSEELPESETIRDVKILGILGDSGGIDIRADEEAIGRLSGASPEFLYEPKRADFARLWDERWDILFFAGHSETQADGKTGLLYINPHERLNIEEIRRTLTTAKEQGLKLAIFNSCDGLGLARQLADLNIPQIIVWREPIPDLVAQKFLKYFLNSFAKGKSLYRSVRDARDKLQELEPEIEEQLPGVTSLPVICQNMVGESVSWEKLRGGKDNRISGDDRKLEAWINKSIASVGIIKILLGIAMIGFTLIGFTLSFTTNINISIPDQTTRDLEKGVLFEGYKFLQNRDYDRAEEKFNQASRQEPKSPDTWYWKAQLALARENKPVALKYVDRALHLDPNHLHSLVLKIKLLLLKGGHHLVEVEGIATQSQGIGEELDLWLNCLEKEKVFSSWLNTDSELDVKCSPPIYKW